MTAPDRGRSRRRAPRGALVLLAGLLAGSGAIRVGLGVQEARALEPPETVAAVVPQSCEQSPEALIEALRLREEKVATLEASVADRLAALALAEQAIQSQIAALEAAEAELAATLARADGAAEADLARLTTVYETMKPKDAAALFEAMAPEFAAGFLGRMRPENAGAILSGMPAEAGYAISVLMAGRNALVPRQ